MLAANVEANKPAEQTTCECFTLFIDQLPTASSKQVRLKNNQICDVHVNGLSNENLGVNIGFSVCLSSFMHYPCPSPGLLLQCHH